MTALVDTHCHINFDSYADDREAVLKRAAEVGVRQVINPAIDISTSRDIVELTAHYDNLYSAVGIHPNSSADFTDSMLDEIALLAKQPNVLAIGEIGLDYHWDKSPKEQQLAAFEKQLALAASLELPVIIHNREASEDVISILENWASTLSSSLKERPGVLHSFSAPAAVAERALASGFYLGFTGPITYKNADSLRHIAANTPLNRLLVETDGPFLTPVPHRGQRNEPAYIPYMVERLASLQQVSIEQIASATTENAVRLFKLPALSQ